MTLPPGLTESLLAQRLPLQQTGSSQAQTAHLLFHWQALLHLSLVKMATVDDPMNYYLANQVGLTPQQVAYLRQEFQKFGRNPLDATLEILAIENSFDERKVKVRRLGGWCAQGSSSSAFRICSNSISPM